jgi:hypothetical protein
LITREKKDYTSISSTWRHSRINFDSAECAGYSLKRCYLSADMKHILFIGFATLSLIVNNVEAKIGETKAQTDARYGDDTDISFNGQSVTYCIKMLRIFCDFNEEKCVRIEYRIATPGSLAPLTYDARFNDESKALLLILNQGGSKFLPFEKKLEYFDFTDVMKTEDGKTMALISEKVIVFESIDYVEERQKNTESAAIRDAVKTISKP